MKKLITLAALVMVMWTFAVIYAGWDGTDSKSCHLNYIQHLTYF